MNVSLSVDGGEQVVSVPWFSADALTESTAQAKLAVRKGKSSCCRPQARATKKLAALGTVTTEQDR